MRSIKSKSKAQDQTVCKLWHPKIFGIKEIKSLSFPPLLHLNSSWMRSVTRMHSHPLLKRGKLGESNYFRRLLQYNLICPALLWFFGDSVEEHRNDKYCEANSPKSHPYWNDYGLVQHLPSREPNTSNSDCHIGKRKTRRSSHGIFPSMCESDVFHRFY